jgi:putative endopeptidase
MADRQYYLSQSPRMAQLRKQYREHIERMFKLAGFTAPASRAARVFALETAMAGVHATRVESEDVHSAVQWKRADLPLKAPGIDWPALLEAAGLSDPPVGIGWRPKAVAGLSALAAREPLDAWKDWLAYHAVESAAAFLPRAFGDERFNSYGKAFSGVPQTRPRWQRGIDLTNFALRDAVGKLYVERYFPAETKVKPKANWIR